MSALLAAAALAQAGPASAAPGDIATVAGTGTGGFSGDGGPATTAQIDGPRGVSWMPDGGFVFADNATSHVRRVYPDGSIATVAGTGVDGYNGDGIAATSAQINFVHGAAALPDGSILICDELNRRIRKVSNGVITTVAGNGTKGYSGDFGPATSAMIADPRGFAPLPGGGFLIADTDNHRVRRVDGLGTITTVAGDGTLGYSGDGGPATAARLNKPFGVSPAPDGGFLIADAANNRIRRVYPDGTIRTVAGNGTAGSSGDGGPATAASLTGPHAVEWTPEGGFLIADNSSNRVRYVSPAGTITTAAGTGAASSSGDGGPAPQAGVYGPKGLAVRTDGTYLVAEFSGDRIRSVAPQPAASGAPAITPATRPTSVLAAVSGLAFSNKSFAAESSGPPATNAKRKPPRGTKVSFHLSKAATVRFTVTRRVRGRKLRHAKKTFCVKPTKKNHKRKACTRVITLKGSFSRNGVAGKNSFHFTGRLNGRKLPGGRYRLVATLSIGRTKGKPTSTGFRIVR